MRNSTHINELKMFWKCTQITKKNIANILFSDDNDKNRALRSTHTNNISDWFEFDRLVGWSDE